MLHDIVIQNASEADAKEVSLAFRHAYTPLFKKQNLSQTTIEEMYNDNDEKHIIERFKGNFFFVARHVVNRGLVGLIGLRKHDDSKQHNQISTFFVLEEFRGEGVGRALFDEVMKLVENHNIKTLVVNSSLSARSIYEHWGFYSIEIREKVYPNGDRYQSVWMEKKID
jgi:ribosomal protein S18 acetylase RimI-like enzyme